MRSAFATLGPNQNSRFHLLVIVGMLAGIASLGGSSASSVAAQDACPVPPQDISPIGAFETLSVQGSEPSASAEQAIDVTGYDGQELTLAFDTFQERQNANSTFDSVTSQVLFDGNVVFSNTISLSDPAQVNDSVSVPWTVPAGATEVTLQATLTLNNDPPSSYTSGPLYLTVDNISLLTPEIPCPEPDPPPQGLIALIIVIILALLGLTAQP